MRPAFIHKLSFDDNILQPLRRMTLYAIYSEVLQEITDKNEEVKLAQVGKIYLRYDRYWKYIEKHIVIVSRILFAIKKLNLVSGNSC